MLIAKPRDVYQIQPGLSPRSRYTEARFLSREGHPFPLLSSRSFSLPPFLPPASHSRFPLRENAEYSNFVVLGKSDKRELDRPRPRSSLPLCAGKIREHRSFVRHPGCRGSFASLVPFRSSNGQCQVLEINTRRGLIHLDSAAHDLPCTLRRLAAWLAAHAAD